MPWKELFSQIDWSTAFWIFATTHQHALPATVRQKLILTLVPVFLTTGIAVASGFLASYVTLQTTISQMRADITIREHDATTLKIRDQELADRIKLLEISSRECVSSIVELKGRK